MGIGFLVPDLLSLFLDAHNGAIIFGPNCPSIATKMINVRILRRKFAGWSDAETDHSMKGTFNLKSSGEVFPINKGFLHQFGLFEENQSLLTAEESETRAQVPVSVVQTFVGTVQGSEIEPCEENCRARRVLSEEFRLADLTAKCAASEALDRAPCEATTEAVTDALAKRVSHVEEQSVLLERGSAMVGETVRSICDQLAFLDNEVRRLSEVCGGFVKQNNPGTVDNLTSATPVWPLSADQGRIQNEETGTIDGCSEGGSAKPAKLTQKLDIPRTVSVSGSGTTSFDGSEDLRDWLDAEETYRRGCEWFFGLPGEERAKTMGIRLLKQSAEMGHSDGQYRYGRWVLYGEKGCEKDPQSGTEYLRGSAEQGNSWGEAEYGNCLLVGLGVERDIAQGMKYVERSAGKSNPRGQALLGACLENGIGIEKNLTRAVDYYRDSANQGNSDGECNFGRCLEYGIGIEKDLIRAADYYRLSAEQGNPTGQSNFGRCLEHGIGIEKDLIRAAGYYRLSADQGNSTGQYHFGRCLEHGIGIEIDLNLSADFYCLSAAQRDFYGCFGSPQSIVIPSWVRLLDQRSFSIRRSLGSVTFERGSRLEWVGASSFSQSGLNSIEIPSSVVVLGTSCFFQCSSLESVRFETGSRLERIEESAFCQSGLKSIDIPSSVVVLDKLSFSQCSSLGSVIFESGSRLERIGERAFADSGLKSI
jgi:TPR repeat protein